VLDVTSHVELEATLREQVRTKNDFIATVSHELRTPLTAVVGFIDELGAVLDEPSPDALEMIDIVAAEATSLSAIVEDLLVAASADIDRLAVVVEEVDVGGVIDRVVRASSRLVVENGASLEVQCCDEAIAIADPRRVEQILWNLVTNAVRHGGSAITVAGRRDGDHRISVTVQDSGAGIPAGLSDEVFKPYSSLALNEGVTPSMGLGLYVAQKLARLMDGELSATGDNGASEFTLDLPAAHMAVAGESA
jgi:two-component system sensor histidine kinase ChiS